MTYLTMTLFERLGLVLVLAFVLTRTPGFRSLLYRELNLKMSIVHACVFGAFGIASTITGIVIEEGFVIQRNFIWSVESNEFVVSSSLVAIVIAGLLGGPVVGFGAGLIAGGHLFLLGGIGAFANGIVNPITGLLAGLTARFFSDERVISPFKALFIGIFPPILHMQLLLIFHSNVEETIHIVDNIGLPLVLSNSIAIAIFTAMIGVILKEQENEAALATKQALSIAEEALPFLNKDDPNEMANGIARLLYHRLKLAAVSVTKGKEVLAHVGLGDDHHRPGTEISTRISNEAIETREMKVAYSRSEIQCVNEKCPLEAAIIIPVEEGNDDVTLIKFYFKKKQHIRPVELMLAQGLGQLLSNQWKGISAEKLKEHMRETELRNLQAQINPHFLFNTLHLIASLSRKEPAETRHITIQLANYMRFNLRLVSKSLIPLEKEIEHVRAYIDIIQARFKSRLEIELTCQGEVGDVFIPPATLQPLVENSVQHGLGQVTKNGRIEVSIEEQETEIKISVKDNGIGISEEIQARLGTEPLKDRDNGGVGLFNVNQRLVQLLGDSARLHIKKELKTGSEIYFYIPKNAKERRE